MSLRYAKNLQILATPVNDEHAATLAAVQEEVSQFFKEPVRYALNSPSTDHAILAPDKTSSNGAGFDPLLYFDNPSIAHGVGWASALCASPAYLALGLPDISAMSIAERRGRILMNAWDSLGADDGTGVTGTLNTIFGLSGSAKLKHGDRILINLGTDDSVVSGSGGNRIDWVRQINGIWVVVQTGDTPSTDPYYSGLQLSPDGVEYWILVRAADFDDLRDTAYNTWKVTCLEEAAGTTGLDGNAGKTFILMPDSFDGAATSWLPGAAFGDAGWAEILFDRIESTTEPYIKTKRWTIPFTNNYNMNGVSVQITGPGDSTVSVTGLVAAGFPLVSFVQLYDSEWRPIICSVRRSTLDELRLDFALGTYLADYMDKNLHLVVIG
jgi:hypothetical protein